jgi:hypothetical protein
MALFTLDEARGAYKEWQRASPDLVIKSARRAVFSEARAFDSQQSYDVFLSHTHLGKSSPKVLYRVVYRCDLSPGNHCGLASKPDRLTPLSGSYQMPHGSWSPAGTMRLWAEAPLSRRGGAWVWVTPAPKQALCPRLSHRITPEKRA